MPVKTRPAIIVTFLLAVSVLAAPMASASTPAHPVERSANPPHSHSVSPDSSSILTFCLNTNDAECLNLMNCNISDDVQLYNKNTGGTCTTDWNATFEGYVGEGTVGNVFYCGDDLNAKYYGDPDYQVTYATGGWWAMGLGPTEPVMLSDGINNWVATSSNLLDTTLIDVDDSCDPDFGNGTAQFVYAGCDGNGCIVRTAPSPSSLLFWELTRYTF
jgi:hypothetical protein